MNLQQLYYFQKIAECRQYTQAAAELHVTQATLSYAISNLEKELDVRLFERRGKSVELTEAGKAYLTCVRDALQALDRGKRLVQSGSQDKVPVRMECLESVKPLAIRLISQHSAQDEGHRLRFDLSPSNARNIEQKLIRREIDLGISTAPQAEGLASHLMGYQDNVVIVPIQHPWARRKTIALGELDHQPFIIYNQDCVIRGYYDAILRSAQVHPEVFAESRTHSNILDMVAYGMGVAIVPRMQQLKDRFDLAVLNIEDPIPARAIYLIWSEEALLLPEVEHFRRSIVEQDDLSQYI